jgi:aconitase A
MIAPLDTESTCVIVTAAGSEQVHLALLRAGVTPEVTLCGRQVLPAAPTRHFQEAGCGPCAKMSLDQGIDCAQETAQVMVNLRRFYDRTNRGMVQT